MNRSSSWVYILLAVAVLVGLLLAPLPAVRGSGGELIALSSKGQASLAVVALCLTLWISEPLPFAVNLAFIFPVQAAAHLVSYSAGQFSTQDMAKGGILLTLVAACIVGGVVLTVGATTGLYRLR